MAVDVIFAEPLGCYVEVVWNAKLRSIRFVRDEKQLPERKTSPVSLELEEYFEGKRTEFTCECNISVLPPFMRLVLKETQKIGFGGTITYSELARNIGSRAYRAVGRALSSNPYPIVIPCHRVVAKNGIGGYSGGVDLKARLLDFEKLCAVNNL